MVYRSKSPLPVFRSCLKTNDKPLRALLSSREAAAGVAGVRTPQKSQVRVFDTQHCGIPNDL